MTPGYPGVLRLTPVPQVRFEVVKLPLWLARLGLVVGGGALLITAVVVAVAPRLWAIANAHEELPVELPEFEPLAQRTYVYDTDGNEIAVFELENSQPIAYEDIPNHVIQAFLVVEDKEFFNHDGINVRSLVRATLSNFASDAPQQGASTITMQVVKNDFLAGLERDGRYKLLQIHYARMLENAKSKPEILERYLNTVFFGNNAYGIQAAAETYFGKTAADLTFFEAAFLAGLVRSPSGFDPINAPERSRSRWLQIVDRLVGEEIITDEQAVALEEFPIPLRVKTIPTRANKRTYFTEALRDYLLNRTSILGATYEERYNRLFRGGLRIFTTFDPTLQSQAEQARAILPDTPEGFDAAIVSLDVETGAIRAMVGGRGFQPGEREVNMALAPRQTGSSIKAFILAAAVQAGAIADDIIDGTRPCRLPNPGDPSEPFEIRDARSLGPSPLIEQTAKSINCAFARLSQIVGLHRVVDTTYRMASSPYLYQGQPESERAPILPLASYATGANEMSPLDMASGIQTLANVGVHHQPYFVDRIVDPDGESVYEHFDPGTKVFEPDAALRTIEILQEPAVVHLRWDRPSIRPRQRPARVRQDRNPGVQHQRVVHRRHTAAGDGGVGRRPRRLHPDERSDRGVRRSRRAAGAGRHLPRPDLEGVHGCRTRLLAGRGLGRSAPGRPAARPPRAARQRVHPDDRRLRDHDDRRTSAVRWRRRWRRWRRWRRRRTGSGGDGDDDHHRADPDLPAHAGGHDDRPGQPRPTRPDAVGAAQRQHRSVLTGLADWP